MKGFSPFHQEKKMTKTVEKIDRKSDAKKAKELATRVAGKALKGKRRKRPDYIKSDPGLMRYYDAYDAWEDGGKKGSPPWISDYK